MRAREARHYHRYGPLGAGNNSRELRLAQNAPPATMGAHESTVQTPLGGSLARTPCTLPPPTPSSRRQEGRTPVKKKVLASGRAGLQLLESSECWVQLLAGPRTFGTRRALTFMGHESWAMKGVPRFMARPCLPACGISCATSVRVLVTRCESHGAPAAPTGAALCSCGCGGCRNES